MKLKTLNVAMSLALTASALTLFGCGGASTTDTGLDVRFTPIALPTDATTQNAVQATDGVEINGTAQSIGYTKLIATGEMNNTETFGQVKNYLGVDITFPVSGDPYICNGTNDGVGSGLDHFSVLQKNSKLYMVSQFECQVGAMYMSELTQDATTGALSVTADTLQFIDQSPEFGGFVHCAGQTTPWNSHLGSEEYETDARWAENNADPTTGLTGNPYYDDTAKFWGDDATLLSPYYYGWTPEVQVTATGAPDFKKHYAMGRFSHELAYVMPDEKTVYLSDDGTNVGLFMFVADTAGDLSAGSLYAAKWTQTSAAGLGEATLSWIDLGHANNAQIRNVLDSDKTITTNDAPVFSDLFNVEPPSTADGSCPTVGFTAINTSAGNECLKINDIDANGIVDAGDEIIVSRLETRRYAAMKGATTEFRKEEGITFNARDSKLYVAMSQIAYGLEDNMKKGVAETKYDIGGNNDIKLDYNACGGVYALDVTADSTIGSDYVAQNMKGLVAGTPTDYSSDPLLSANKCDVDGISMPDNVSFLADSDVLVIGEDSSLHENNMIWAYNIKKGTLDRIFTTPLGAETTSPFWYKDVNGFGYLTTVTQHPDLSTDLAGETEAGVIGTFDFNK